MKTTKIMKRFRWIHLLGLVWISCLSVTRAAPLDPADFSSLGPTLTPSTSVVIDTSTSPPTINVDGTGPINGVIDSTSGASLAVFTYNEINLASGVTVTVTGNIGLALLSQSTLIVATYIDLNGNNGTANSGGGAGGPGADDGGTGAANRHNEYGEGQGGSRAPGGGASGGGSGVSYGGAGGMGGRKVGIIGPTYGDDDLNRAFGGSGGASGQPDGDGGGGGGFIQLVAVNGLTIASTANISVSGGTGGHGTPAVQEGGDGGSGGGILCVGYTVTLDGNLDASGGHEGNPDGSTDNRAGGGGGGGRIAIFSTEDFDSAGEDQMETSFTGVDISGGVAGTPNSDGSADPGNTGTLWDGSAPAFTSPPGGGTVLSFE